MFSFAALFGDREIDGWRDDWILVAAGALNGLARQLSDRVDRELREASDHDLFRNQKTFLATRIQPLLNAGIEREVEAILDNANQALRLLRDHQAVFYRTQGPVPAELSTVTHAMDAASVIAPLAGAVAIGAALPGAAVTTTATWFGLATVTVISWPIVLGGGALMLGAAAVAGWAATTMRPRLEARLRQQARDLIAATLLKGTAKQPAVLTQITQALTAAAAEARRMPRP